MSDNRQLTSIVAFCNHYLARVKQDDKEQKHHEQLPFERPPSGQQEAQWSCSLTALQPQDDLDDQERQNALTGLEQIQQLSQQPNAKFQAPAAPNNSGLMQSQKLPTSIYKFLDALMLELKENYGKEAAEDGFMSTLFAQNQSKGAQLPSTSSVRLLSKEIVAFQREVVQRTLHSGRVMSGELISVESSEKEMNQKVQTLVKETKEVTKRKRDLQDKLKDLDSLKYVVDELERKENALLEQKEDEERYLTDRIDSFQKNVQLFKLGVTTAFDSMGNQLKSVLHPNEYMLDQALDLRNQIGSMEGDSRQCDGFNQDLPQFNSCEMLPAHRRLPQLDLSRMKAIQENKFQHPKTARESTDKQLEPLDFEGLQPIMENSKSRQQLQSYVLSKRSSYWERKQRQQTQSSRQIVIQASFGDVLSKQSMSPEHSDQCNNLKQSGDKAKLRRSCKFSNVPISPEKRRLPPPNFTKHQNMQRQAPSQPKSSLEEGRQRETQHKKGKSSLV